MPAMADNLGQNFLRWDESRPGGNATANRASPAILSHWGETQSRRHGGTPKKLLRCEATADSRNPPRGPSWTRSLTSSFLLPSASWIPPEALSEAQHTSPGGWVCWPGVVRQTSAARCLSAPVEETGKLSCQTTQGRSVQNAAELSRNF
ncbi:hypothetical protein AAFF_G00201520 [Aldrovandia affinis]|uniref:Ig-like domain-containing protein n=1 Tax=Aldrovandia affinis TaxID=143900 RepID=A0AAD7WUN7_9TELE|nr:hypothetical protein AAFF_G00201520 [Aldrovandia affinis]